MCDRVPLEVRVLISIASNSWLVTENKNYVHKP